MKRSMWVAMSAMAVGGLFCGNLGVGAIRRNGQSGSRKTINSGRCLQGDRIVRGQIDPAGSQKGSGGDLNFALPDGQLILMANFQDAKYYTQSKAMKDVYGGEVQGVGDEAFIGKVMGQESLLYFRKGTQSVALSSFFDMKNGIKPYLNQQQLRQLAALILSRM
jgi:hypothetical protein